MEETFFPQSSTLTCQVYNAMDLYRYMAMAHNSSVYIHTSLLIILQWHNYLPCKESEIQSILCGIFCIKAQFSKIRVKSAI